MDNMHQQFMEAGTLMLTGMVFVFTFLSFLIIFINTVLSKFALKYPDKPSPTQTKLNKKRIVAAKGDISPVIVAAISGAVTRYRQQHVNSQQHVDK